MDAILGASFASAYTASMATAAAARREYPIPIPYEAIADFCRRNHIRKLSLFGSILRDDFTPESDVDFLSAEELNRRYRGRSCRKLSQSM